MKYVIGTLRILHNTIIHMYTLLSITKQKTKTDIFQIIILNDQIKLKT